MGRRRSHLTSCSRSRLTPAAHDRTRALHAYGGFPVKKLLMVALPAVVFGVTSLVVHGQAPRVSPDTYSQLRWRFVGPEGNRFSSVAGVPGDPLVYYGGSASGGIFKTLDGGINWEPIFDQQPVSSVGSLAVAPSDSNVVWAGTGEAWIRSHISIGEGIFKSTD